jgi:hypothetical protein
MTKKTRRLVVDEANVGSTIVVVQETKVTINVI